MDEAGMNEPGGERDDVGHADETAVPNRPAAPSAAASPAPPPARPPAADVFATAAVPAAPLRPATFPYRPGDLILPGYRLTRRIGSGGFGEVWRAEAPGGMGVAIKVLANLGRREGAREYRALMTIRNIRHAHIVPLFGIWLKSATGHLLDEDELHEAGDRLLATGTDRDARAAPGEALESLELIVAMGLGDQTLYDRLQDAKRSGAEALPPSEVLPWMQQAALALDHFNSGSRRHAENATAVQHCDIKPQNLLLVGDVVQVCDFGLARAQGEVRATSNTMASLAYAAPEMISPPYDPAPTTDQYCLAITYIELRTGRLPYRELTPLTIMRAKLDGALDLGDIPPPEARVLERALAVDPAKRWQSCVDFVRALRSTARQDGLISGTVTQSDAVSHGVKPAAVDPAWTETRPDAALPATASAATSMEARRPPAGRNRLLAAVCAGAIAAIAAGIAFLPRGASKTEPAGAVGGDRASSGVPGAASTAAASGGATVDATPAATGQMSAAAAPATNGAPGRSSLERAVARGRDGDFRGAADDYAVVFATDRDKLATALFALEEDAYNAGRLPECIALYERLERLYAAEPPPRVKDKTGGEFTKWYVTNMLAWYLATQPAADQAAGERARRLAEASLEMAGDTRQNRAQSLDTLAAAAARVGDWEEALRRIDAAIEIASPEDDDDFRRRRASYEKHVPWNEP